MLNIEYSNFCKENSYYTEYQSLVNIPECGSEHTQYTLIRDFLIWSTSQIKETERNI